MIKSTSIIVNSLTPQKWEVYREIRLEGLKVDPQAFGRSYEEEKDFPKEKWIERVSNPYNIVAIENEKVLGTMSANLTVEDNEKVAHVVGVFVIKEARGKGIGSKLLSEILKRIKKDQSISKIELSVN